MANVTIAPDADDTDGNWTTYLGGTVLYGAVDENEYEDADFILSGASPNADICKLRLSDPAQPMFDPMTVEIRAKASVLPMTLMIRLVEGSTTRAEWEENLTDSWATYSNELTADERETITDFTNLYVELEASTDATLLAGETDGLAIDWTATADFERSTWAMEAVQERNSSVDTLQSPHVFFTQSGTSAKYVKNSETTIGWSPHNLLLQSQDAATTWTNNNTTETTDSTVAPDGTTTGDTLTQATATTNCYLTQSITTVSGFAYCFSAYLKASGTATDWARLYLTDGTDSAGTYFDITNGALGSNTSSTWTVAARGIESVGSGWYRCYIVVVTDNTTTTARIELAEADNDSDVQASDAIIVWGMQVNRGYSPTAYIATTTAAKIGLPISYGEGLLVEPAKTNICLQSQDFTTTWTNTNTDEPTTNNTAPDGSATADEIAATSTANQAFAIFQGFTGRTAGAETTCSVYAKIGTNATLIQLAWDADGTGADGCFCNFNISTGAAGTITAFAAGTATSASITSIGSGWYRCVITGAIAVGTVGRLTISVVDLITEAGFGSANLTDNDSVILWGAQVETGTVATSYILTVAASVTRAADVPLAALSSYPHSDSTGTWIVECVTRITDVAASVSIIHAGAASGNRIVMQQITTGSPDRFNLFINEAPTAGVGAASTSGNKVAIAYELNNSSVLADGGSEQVDTSCTMETLTSNVYFGHNPVTSGREYNGYLKTVVYVPRRMTEAEMQNKTA